MNKQLVRFGFWSSKNEPHLPIPMASIFDNEEIVERLVRTQSMVGKENSPVTRESYRGLSICRICDKAVEYSEYTYQFANRIYVWPGNLQHYLIEHNIEPPKALREMVGYPEFKWKLKRGEANMQLFPFNVIRGLGHIFEKVRPEHIRDYTLCGQIISETQVRLLATDTNHNIIYDQTLTVSKDQLADIIYDRKFWIAEQEYRERIHARRVHDIETIMKEIFGE